MNSQHETVGSLIPAAHQNNLFMLKFSEISDMQEEENVRLVKQTYAAFKRKDLVSVADAFTKDAILQGPTLKKKVYRGEACSRVKKEQRNSSKPSENTWDLKCANQESLLFKVRKLSS